MAACRNARSTTAATSQRWRSGRSRTAALTLSVFFSVFGFASSATARFAVCQTTDRSGETERDAGGKEILSISGLLDACLRHKGAVDLGSEVPADNGGSVPQIKDARAALQCKDGRALVLYHADGAIERRWVHCLPPETTTVSPVSPPVLHSNGSYAKRRDATEVECARGGSHLDLCMDQNLDGQCTPNEISFIDICNDGVGGCGDCSCDSPLRFDERDIGDPLIGLSDTPEIHAESALWGLSPTISRPLPFQVAAHLPIVADSRPAIGGAVLVGLGLPRTRSVTRDVTQSARVQLLWRALQLRAQSEAQFASAEFIEEHLERIQKSVSDAEVLEPKDAGVKERSLDTLITDLFERWREEATRSTSAIDHLQLSAAVAPPTIAVDLRRGAAQRASLALGSEVSPLDASSVQGRCRSKLEGVLERRVNGTDSPDEIAVRNELAKELEKCAHPANWDPAIGGHYVLFLMRRNDGTILLDGARAQGTVDTSASFREANLAFTGMLAGGVRRFSATSAELLGLDAEADLRTTLQRGKASAVMEAGASHSPFLEKATGAPTMALGWQLSSQLAVSLPLGGLTASVTGLARDALFDSNLAFESRIVFGLGFADLPSPAASLLRTYGLTSNTR